MTREEFIKKWVLFEDGQMVKDLDELLSIHPAEGAEAFVKSKGLNLDYVKGIQLFLNPKYTVIDLMTEFAAQQQPTAEGAEEILRKNCNTCYSRSTGEEEVWSSVSSVLIAMQDFATLHAQRIADKMVGERLIEFGEMIRDEPNGDIAALAEYFIRTINLKSRER